ncbi:ABC transporter permease [Planosporangium thailandense]|uniref:ABC transporter permease n=1 Tax=Planosporangium thailandense TaxID=765197 RepID=A0ABX0Y1I7_9ACTN|nr:ABC transporter permease [Planosporangium thailandense]NJC72007.1 ABC transporter permease [Planosporangium thailandense]
MLWLLAHSVRRAPRRLLLAAVGVAFPVAMLGATLLFVDGAVRSMTSHALAPVQLEMRAVATSVNVDMAPVDRRLAAVRHVRQIDRFAAADVVLSAPGVPGQVPARLFAVDASYTAHHPWVRVVSGRIGDGALLGESLRTTAGFGAASTVTMTLPDVAEGTKPPSLSLPVRGTIDLRQANPWFAVPVGDAQGDIDEVPKALVIDYATFERSVLPALRQPQVDHSDQVLDQGSGELPAATLETHITVDHASYPTDPAQALRWSNGLRRVLERQSPGAVVVADNAADALTSAKEDATNAKILFLLLGLPGALVAAGVGLAAASALVEAHRREEALLQLRGATSGQLARFTAAQGVLAGVIGAALGLLVAAASVDAVTGRQVWRDTPLDSLVTTALIAVGAGFLTTAVRLVPLVRAARRPEITNQRRLLDRGRSTVWTGVRLELVLIAVAGAILGVNAWTGGLRQTGLEAQDLALAFYVLLAPIALWLGLTLLLVRLLRGLLVRATSPTRPRPLATWLGTALRWLGRRPARTGTAVILGALAVAFGTNVVTFAATYQVARQSDTLAAFGADLRLTSTAVPATAVPALGPEVAATTPIRMVPSRLGSDSLPIMAIDVASYRETIASAPRMVTGEGLDALAANPTAVLVSSQVADDFSVSVGDTLNITIFPDDQKRLRNINLTVAGVYRAFAPTDPAVGVVTTSTAVQSPAPADYYLARVAPGLSSVRVAEDVRRQTRGLMITTLAQHVQQEERGLTTLDLRGLGSLESVAAAVIAGVGVAVLGAFLVLERRRESAILRAIGATTRQVLTAPAAEGAITVVLSLLIGVPVGIGLSIVSIKVLGLFFVLPPPLVVVPTTALLGFGAFMIAVSVLALGVTLRSVARQDAAPTLRG